MIEKFEFLVALARERHFRRAAERCGVTQPSLSAGIKALEEFYGVALVNRNSRYLGLTPEGERVLEWARRIVGDARALRQDIEILKRGVSGVVRLACIPTALPVAARLSAILGARYPDLAFSILSAATPSIVGMLEDFQIDAGITYLDVRDFSGLATEVLFSETYCLVTASPSVFPGRQSVRWDEIGSTPLCLFTPDMQNRRIVDQMLGLAAGERPSAPYIETNSSLVMATLVSSGGWSSIMPPVLFQAVALSADARSIPMVDPAVEHTVGLIAIDRAPPTPLIRALQIAGRELRDILLNR
jgi:DNA-binding transcriptional LysR family regulator